MLRGVSAEKFIELAITRNRRQKWGGVLHGNEAFVEPVTRDC
jgi:hypothetical protein